ncbi:hypothetical protein [Pseudomonas sp. KNUC1026]|uniref:hypothetical protein n=1 Tax=Pseudomonas sp. KNUC1026 TaxID=2893890 RepID=UPI003FA71CEE
MKRKFVCPPHGPPDFALRRRLDNMLCSAIKYRSTDHIASHPEQIGGSKEPGVPPLTWVRRHALEIIQHMIHA